MWLSIHDWLDRLLQILRASVEKEHGGENRPWLKPARLVMGRERGMTLTEVSYTLARCQKCLAFPSVLHVCMFRMCRCKINTAHVWKITTVCDVSHVISVTRPSSLSFFLPFFLQIFISTFMLNALLCYGCTYWTCIHKYIISFAYSHQQTSERKTLASIWASYPGLSLSSSLLSFSLAKKPIELVIPRTCYVVHLYRDCRSSTYCNSRKLC